ncbi:hypothetical protein [Alkalilimnicola ehrlichii]|uniref:hypothetical protein n=1 Tax=Alkalilimnicola ehrlichii TaxID=351052 RepID=UPI000E2F9BC2|nr:hypothetical protein [Alkalilimnicola ehrlichii]
MPPGTGNGSHQETRDAKHRQTDREGGASTRNLPSEGSVAERQYQDYALHYSDADATNRNSPDVLLDIPVAKVDEIDFELEDLKARVSLQTEVFDLVKLSVGIDARLGQVKLRIAGVEAQALLKVRLDNVTATVDRVLTTVDRNPDVLRDLVQGVSSSLEQVSEGTGEAVEAVGEGAGKATKEVGQGAGSAAEDVGAGAGQAAEEVGEETGKVAESAGEGVEKASEAAGESAGKATDEASLEANTATEQARQTASTTADKAQNAARHSTENAPTNGGENPSAQQQEHDWQILGEHRDDSGGIVQRAIDQSGDIVEIKLNADGGIEDEDIVGNISELDIEDERSSDSGATIRHLRDDQAP